MSETTGTPTTPTAPSTPSPAAGAGRRERILGMTGQTAGIVGIVVCIALIVGVLFLRGWAVDRVDQVAGRVDDGLAKGIPLLDTASTRIDEVSARVGVVADAAAARAAIPGPAPELVQRLQSALAGVSDRYLALRESYAGARENVVSVLDRLNTIDRLLPGVSIPQGPVDKLTALDARLQEVDASVMAIINADPGIGSGQVAATIADKASQVESALANVSTGLGDASTRLGQLRTDVQAKADQVKLLITLGTLVLILVLLYSILLHWVLFRSGQRVRRGDPAG